MTASSPEWTNAAQALGRAVAACGDEWEAIHQLRGLAEDQKVRSRGIIRGQLEELDKLFWTRWAEFHPVEDWESGRFEGLRRGSEEEQERERKLFRLTGVSKVEFRTADLDGYFPAAGGKKRAAGRPPAHWWQHVAEELAVFVHDGLPERPEQVIRGLLDRLSERAVEPLPSRSALQPVVESVLSRIRRP
jgi:hypothetical protein